MLKQGVVFRGLIHGCVSIQEPDGRGSSLIIKGAPQVPIQVLIVSSPRGDVGGFPAALQTWGRVLLGVLLDQKVLLRHLVPLPEVDSVLSSR